MKLIIRIAVFAGWTNCLAGLLLTTEIASSADYVPFVGERTTWHAGFERFDFLMDAETLEIEPFKRPDDERFGVKDPPAGKRRCIVIVPEKPADGHPWSWRGCYWDHQPQLEVELLRRGFHVAYISASAALKPDRTWDAWYAHLNNKHGLSTKPAFVGMSRGGEFAYQWSTSHTQQVSCIYADNPAINAESLSKLGDLARADVPILHVCGSIDPLLGRCSNTIETIYRQLGGQISVIIKEGAGHHPHSLRDPQMIADFMTQSFVAEVSPRPKFLAGRITKTAFYSSASLFEDFPNEGTYLTRRGPGFTGAYDRYSFELSGVEGPIHAILPNMNAAGMPWIFRADLVNSDSVVDLALLAKGFSIVTGAVPYNADGPNLLHWNKIYEHLVNHGFSTKPVLSGMGGAAGEAYAWAIAHPDKVACIYAEDPLLRCTMTRQQPLDGLEVLAKARVPILHACGRLSPLLESQTGIAEKRLHELGSQLTVLLNDGAGSCSIPPRDVTAVVQFVEKNAQPVSRKGIDNQR